MCHIQRKNSNYFADLTKIYYIPILDLIGKKQYILRYLQIFTSSSPTATQSGYLVPPNYYVLLSHRHPKWLFGISYFLAQKETDGSVIVFVSRQKKYHGDIVNICLMDIFKPAFLGRKIKSLQRSVLQFS